MKLYAKYLGINYGINHHNNITTNPLTKTSNISSNHSLYYLAYNIFKVAIIIVITTYNSSNNNDSIFYQFVEFHSTQFPSNEVNK